MDTPLDLRIILENDILSLDTCDRYIGQEIDELLDGCVCRYNPKTYRVENIDLPYYVRASQESQREQLADAMSLLMGLVDVQSLATEAVTIA
ncbi:MAG: hypothetical protein ACFBSC_10650 [Microcoleaceae cyanobacterium]